MLGKVKKVHFVGIGGVGMSGLARILIQSGFSVSGSDTAGNHYVENLLSLGARVYPGHSAGNVKGSELVVYSTAVKDDNPELQTARELKVPCVHRSMLLSEIMSSRRSIAVSGTHGKTTTASMLSVILSGAGFDPGFVIGGDHPLLCANASAGGGRWLVCEADESDGSFLNLNPNFAVITNIEDDHLDYYGSFDKLESAFSSFADKIFSNGGIVAFSDHPVNMRVIGGMDKGRSIVFGFSPGCQVKGSGYMDEFGSLSFNMHAAGRDLGAVKIPLTGIHNGYNALGAAAIALYLGVSFDRIRDSLSGFSGVRRRFERMGEVNGILVIEDYAHHPTEIGCTLASAKKSGRRVIAVFQPHRYSRTKALLSGLEEKLFPADSVILTDIYSADEPFIEGVSSKILAESMKKKGHPSTVYVPDKKHIPAVIGKTAEPGDLVIILGAGDINSITPSVLEALGAEQAAGVPN